MWRLLFALSAAALFVGAGLVGFGLAGDGREQAGRSAAEPAPERAPSASARLFRGDFEVGPPGWSQFSGYQVERERPVADSFELVTSPVRQGRYAAKFTVRQGYSAFGHNEDSELVWFSRESEGDEYWYAWSTLFPKGWRAPDRWGIFAQWHSSLPTSPPLAFDAREDTVALYLHAGQTDERRNRFAFDHSVPLLTSLSKGRWNDFVLRVRWSGSARGLIEVWHRVEGARDFRRLVSLRDVPTLQVGSDGKTSTVSLLWGLYRGSRCPQPTSLRCERERDRQPDSVIFQDGFTRGRSFGAVVTHAFPAR